MRFTRSCIAAAALLAPMSAVQADYPTLPVTGPTTVFNDATPLVGFIDVLSFTGVAPATYTDTGSFTGFNLNPGGATFDGTPVPLATTGPVTNGLLTGSFTATGVPLLLALAGTTAGPGAAYTGFLNLSPIPAPETYAMLLASLGALGLMASRSRQQG